MEVPELGYPLAVEIHTEAADGQESVVRIDGFRTEQEAWATAFDALTREQSSMLFPWREVTVAVGWRRVTVTGHKYKKARRDFQKYRVMVRERQPLQDQTMEDIANKLIPMPPRKATTPASQDHLFVESVESH